MNPVSSKYSSFFKELGFEGINISTMLNTKEGTG